MSFHRPHPYRQDSDISTPPPDVPIATPIPLSARAANGYAHLGLSHQPIGLSSATETHSNSPSPAHASLNSVGRQFYSTPPSPSHGSFLAGTLLQQLPNRVISGSPAISEDDESEKKRRFRPSSYPTLIPNGKFGSPNGGLFGDSNYSPRGKRRYSRFTDVRWWKELLYWAFRWFLFFYVLVAVAVFTGLLLFGYRDDVAELGSQAAARARPHTWFPFFGSKRTSDGKRGEKGKPSAASPEPTSPPAPLPPDVHPPVPQLPLSIQRLPYNPETMFNHLAEVVGPRTVSQKLFQFALKPFEVMAFFVKATKPPPEGSISIATLIDSSRFKRLATLVKAYNGHLSVALQLRPEEVERQIAKLGQLIQSDPNIRERCDIHLVITPHPRQLNLLRNVARFFARTDLIIQLDADFLATTDIAAHVEELGYRDRLLSGEIALVVPAFEWSEEKPSESGGVHSIALSDPSLANWPESKEELLEQFQSKRLQIFHHQWAVGHGATDFERWQSTAQAYEITDNYHHSFEPYLIMRRDYDGTGMPYCDERLVGYGGNKAACVFEGHLSGVKLYVMPDDWVIHQRHPYPELERRSERSYNRRLYESLREEMCVRYNRMQTADDSADGTVGEDDAIGCARHSGPASKAKSAGTANRKK